MLRSIARWSCGIFLWFRCPEPWLTSRSENPFASWAASRTKGRIGRMKDVMTEPPDHQHSTRGQVHRARRKKNRYAGSGALRLLGHQLEFIGHSAELGKRTGLHLLHRPAAMHLDCGLGDPDIKGNLFAKPAARNLNHDLALPGAERGETLPEVRQSFFIFPPRTIARKTELNGVEEVLVAERLGQKLNGTPLHRLHGHRDIAVSR